MKKLIVLLLLICAVPAYGLSRDPVSRHWEYAFFGGAGTTSMVLPDLEIPNRVYAVSDVAGSFVTTDKGEQWLFNTKGATTIINSAIAQSEYNPDILYILGNKLIKSVDRGKTWFPLADFVTTKFNTHKSIAIGRRNPDILYVGLQNGKIMKSVDGGDNFTEYATPFGTNLSPYFIYIDPTDSYLIVGGEAATGLKRYDLSDDSVSTITLTGTNATYNWDYDKYKVGAVEHFCVTAGWKVACTVDNGDNWTYTAAASSDPLYFMSRMASKYLASTDVRFITHLRRISSRGGTTFMEVSDDSGATWTDTTHNATYDVINNPSREWFDFGDLGSIYSIAFDPLNEDVVYASTDWCIWRSDDGGQTWTEKVKGAQGTVIGEVVASPNGILFACGMDPGCYKSTDNGDHWTAAIPNTGNAAPQGFSKAGWYWRVVTLGTEAEWDAGTGVVIMTSNVWADFISRIVRSTDSGATWTIITSGLPTTLLNGKSAGNANNAAWGFGLARALACHPNGSVCYLGIDGYSATENGGIFYSTDKGLTWHRTTQPPQWKVYNGISVDPTDPTGYTVSFTEWFQTSPALPHTYKSTDRGVTWTEVYTTSGVFDLNYNSAGNVFTTGLSGRRPRIDYSTNGDSGTWAKMHDMNETEQIADGLYIDPRDENRIFVGINDGTNTGPTVDDGGSGGEASGTTIIGNSIYVTNNAQAFDQATWTDLTGDFPTPCGVMAITVNYYNGSYWLFAATDGAGVFRLKLDDTTPTVLNGMDIGQ